MYDLLLSQPDSKHLISRFVTALTTSQADHLREAWAAELGAPVLDKLWEEGLSGIQSRSIRSRHRLIKFKVLQRLHYSKTKLNKNQCPPHVKDVVRQKDHYHIYSGTVQY